MPNVDVNGTTIEFPDSLSGDELNQAVSKAASQVGQTEKPMSLQGLGENVIKDIPYQAKKIGSGLLSMGEGSYTAPFEGAKALFQTGKEFYQGKPFSETSVAQLPQQFLNTAKTLPAALTENVRHPYEHPVGAAIDVGSIALPFAKPLFGEARAIPGVEEGLEAARTGIRENAVAPNARRALGKFPTNMPVSEANQIGLTAMDQGVIKNPITNPLSSGREAMLNRATTINEGLGESIGSFLKGQGEGLDASKAMSELDKVKEQFMNDPVISRKVDQAKALISKNSGIEQPNLRSAIQLRGKTYVGEPGEIHADVINKIAQETGESPDKVIDAVQKIGDQGFSSNGNFLTRDEVRSMTGERPEAASLLASGKMNPEVTETPKTMDFSKANKLKGLFQNKVNYMSDAATQQSGKAIAGNFRNSIDSQLDDLTSKLGNKEGMDSFKANKKLFGQTRKMQDVLEKQTNRDARSAPVSLPSVGAGIGAFIKGGGLTGGLATLGAEWVKRYGSATAASMMNDVANLVGGIGKDASVSPLAKTIPAVNAGAILKKRSLDEKTALEYLDKAGGDKEKALQMMQKDGY